MKLLRIHYLVNRTPKENYSQSENAYSLQSPERNQKWEALCLAIKAALALEMRWLNPSLSTPNSSVWLLPSRWWGQQEASRTSGVSHYRYVKGIAPLWTLLLPWRSNKESLWTWFWKAGPTGILGAQDTEEYWTGRWKWSPTEADSVETREQRGFLVSGHETHHLLVAALRSKATCPLPFPRPQLPVLP